MGFIKFLKSKAFFVSLILAVVISLLLSVFLLKFLDFYTDHNESIKVPSVLKKKTEAASAELQELGLELVVADTVEFDSDFPPYSIVAQEPKPSADVKSGRKVFVRINAGSYPVVEIPNLNGLPLYEAKNRIKDAGLEVGDIIYVDAVEKGMVIEIQNEGRILIQGDKVRKKAYIDLVVGNGSLSFDESTMNDSLSTPEIINAEDEKIQTVEDAINSIMN